MSEVTQGVNTEATSPVAQADSSGSGDAQAPSEPQEGQNVPYDRFKSVNDQAKAAVAQVNQLQQRDQQWAQRDAARDRQVQQMMAQQHASQRPVDKSEQAPSSTEQLIKNQLGTDEAGTQAYDTLERHFDHKFGQAAGDFASKQDMVNLRAQVKAEVKAEIGSTFATSNRFSEWVDKGMITSEQSRGLQEKLNQDFVQYPQLAERPRDVKARVAELLVEGMEGGNIKPFSQPRPKNPVSVNSSAAPANEPPPLDPGSSRFSRLRGINAEAATKLRDISLARHNGANGEN
jgi:hypothetical protein